MSEKGYVLARGLRSSARLNLQYLVWQFFFDNLTGLHPSIPLPCLAAPAADHLHNSSALDDNENGNGDVAIADIATGTGIFLLHLSSQLRSTAVLDGFDISPAQYPHSALLPSNVRLLVSDATKDPPEQYRGKYDVVHVRLLLAVVDTDDPGPVIRHAKMLLRPGGRLQWDELDPWKFEMMELRGGRMTDEGKAKGKGEGKQEEKIVWPCLHEIRNVIRTTKKTSWIGELDKHFAQNGFEVVVSENLKEKEWQRHMIMETWCLVIDDFATEVETKGHTDKAAELRRLVEGAYAEIKDGAYYENWVKVVVGVRL